MGFTGFEVVVGWDRAMRKRGGQVEAKSQNRAARAQFWTTQCGGVHFWVEGILFGKHTLSLRWWGGAIGQCARRAELEPQSKAELPGLGFGQRNVGGFVFG